MISRTDDHALCRHMISRAESLRRQHPGRALELARAGRTMAATVERAHVGADRWLVLQADAWSTLGSAARACGELREAEAALNVAIGFINDDAYPEHERLMNQCRLAQRAAYLRSSQGRHTEALSLIDDAVGVYATQNPSPASARCSVDRAAILAAAGQFRRALRALVHTLDTVGSILSPQARLAAVHNAALYFYQLADDAESTAEALRWLRLAIRCHQRHSESLDQLKLQGLLGLTAARLGHVNRGMAALRAACVGFARQGAVAEHTMALLDLARLAVVHARQDQLTAVAGQLFPLLRHLERVPDVRQGVLDVVRAIHRGRLGTELVEKAARPLRVLNDLAPFDEPS